MSTTKTTIVVESVAGLESVHLYTEPGDPGLCVLNTGPVPSMAGEPMRYGDEITIDGRMYRLFVFQGRWDFAEVIR